jgi:hypothetical protein
MLPRPVKGTEPKSQIAFGRIDAMRAETRKAVHAELQYFWKPSRVHAAPFRRLSACAPGPCRDASFLLASALSEPRSLATSRLSERAMRSTDLCHPNVNVYPYLVRSRFTSRLAPCGEPKEFGLQRLRSGLEVFHDTPE